MIKVDYCYNMYLYGFLLLFIYVYIMRAANEFPKRNNKVYCTVLFSSFGLVWFGLVWFGLVPCRAVPCRAVPCHLYDIL